MQILNVNPQVVSQPQDVLINLVLAFFLGLVVAIFYKRFHRGLSYSQSFVSSLVFICTIMSLVIMVIGNSLARAFGLAGAFSVIRFRTAVKEIRDIVYLFFALAVGMASGTSNYVMAILGTVLIGGIIFVLDRMNFGSISRFEYILAFQTKSQKDNLYNQVFEKYLKDRVLLNARSIQEGKALELTFNVRLKNKEDFEKLIKELRRTRGISKVSVISSSNNIEY